jgi:hypothetical protein
LRIIIVVTVSEHAQTCTDMYRLTHRHTYKPELKVLDTNGKKLCQSLNVAFLARRRRTDSELAQICQTVAIRVTESS